MIVGLMTCRAKHRDVVVVARVLIVGIGAGNAKHGHGEQVSGAGEFVASPALGDTGIEFRWQVTERCDLGPGLVHHFGNHARVGIGEFF